jgi:aminoglycoside phosphotransferase (APT) family kinase protein
MRAPGPLLARGREADIFEYGPGLVLRRSREGRSMALEARVMGYLAEQGYPVPAVDEMSDDGLDMVLERIDGPTMVDYLSGRPWTIPRQGRALAELHNRLHEISAPTWLDGQPAGAGDKLLHLDLHPLNVLVTKKGPVVIDWAGACRGDPAVDVALAWVLMACGSVETNRLIAAVLGRARAVLVRSFLSGIDLAPVRGIMRDVVTRKVLDPHMSDTEQAQMWQLVADIEAGRA